MNWAKELLKTIHSNFTDNGDGSEDCEEVIAVDDLRSAVLGKRNEIVLKVENCSFRESLNRHKIEEKEKVKAFDELTEALELK